MKIPIRNLYYLFLYAWAKFPGGAFGVVGVDRSPDLPNLFSQLLLDGVRRLLRRGLDRGYESFTTEMPAPRGRLRLDRIIKETTLLRGTVICDFDERTVNILPNQILKNTLFRLAGREGIKTALRHELRLIAKRFVEVDDIRLTASHFRRVAISGVNREYAFLMRLCEFVFWFLMPDQKGAESRFQSILEDETTMSAVFEEFLRNFFRIHRPDYRVGAEAQEWIVTDATSDALSLLPRMLTDITLRHPTHTIIIDAKFYRKSLSAGPYGERVRSQHLYQLVTYLQHEQRRGNGKGLAGLLLYPRTDRELRLKYRLLGIPVFIATIDLSRDSWMEIESELNQLLDLCVARACENAIPV